MIKKYLYNCDIIVVRVQSGVIFVNDDSGDLVELTTIYVQAARFKSHSSNSTTEKSNSCEFN